MQPKPVTKIIVFLNLTFAISGIFYYLIITGGNMQAQAGSYVFGLMWAPGIAGLLTQLTFHRNLRGLGWKLGKIKWLLWGLALPLLYSLAAYLLVWLAGWGRFSPQEIAGIISRDYGVETASPLVPVAAYILVTILIGIPVNSLAALGEEIGWRGFLVPELLKATGSFGKTALISGLIWAIWHYPIVLFAGYHNSGAPLWYALLWFTVLALAVSMVLAWLRLRSGSLWPAVLLHAAHNLFIQSIFTPLTADTGHTAYFIDEFGWVVPVMTALLALYFWRRRGELTDQARAK